MKRTRLTITLRSDLIEVLDTYVDGITMRNRSHAIESLLADKINPPIRKAVILAADQGIKFRPFTYEIPKAMLPINGRPLLEHIIVGLRESEVRDIYISVGYLRDKIISYFGDGSKFGVRITCVKQDKKNVGTGGALKGFEKYSNPKESFFLIYGDVLADINYKDVARFYYSKKERIGVAALTTTDRPELWGVVRLKGDDIVEITEKPKKQTTTSHLISAGIYLFNHKIFSLIPEDKPVSLERDILPNVIKKLPFSGYILEGAWFDISTPQVYEAALRRWV